MRVQIDWRWSGDKPEIFISGSIWSVKQQPRSPAQARQGAEIGENYSGRKGTRRSEAREKCAGPASGSPGVESFCRDAAGAHRGDRLQ